MTRAGSFQLSKTTCAKPLGQECAGCTEGTKKRTVAEATWTRERSVEEESGAGGRAYFVGLPGLWSLDSI